jgi:N-acetylglucosamine-6-phosphate deacetylase
MKAGSRLAGSALRMDHAIRNVLRLGGLSLREAIAMATRNPARVGRIPSRLRGLAPGERADLVRFHYDEITKEIEVLETYLNGKPVFQAT